MEEKGLAQISKRARDLFHHAKKTMASGNLPFALETLRECVKVEPAFFEARHMLRELTLKATKRQKTGGLKALIASFGANGLISKGQKALKAGQMQEALAFAEDAVAKDPSAIKALKFLQSACQQAGLVDAEGDVLKQIDAYYPNDKNHLINLAKYYERVENADGMEDIWGKMSKLFGNDQELMSESKRAAATAAMIRGKWSEEGSYQDKLKDKDKAKELENAEKAVARDAESLQAMIDAAEAKAEENETQTVRKRLAELYAQGQAWEAALANYERCAELAGTVEPNIANMIVEMKENIFNEQIAEADEAQAAELVAQRDDMLFAHAQDMVKRFPNEPSYHFTLGEMLYAREDFNAAIGEMQAAQKNPMFRGKAGRLMGLCFSAKGQFDLAIDQFRTILKDMHGMNAEKKETLYHLGLALEGQGKMEEAVEIYKEIYQADVSYADISAKIDAFYASKNA